MLKALVFGFIASAALIIGAVIAVLLKDAPEERQPFIGRVNKVVMAFGAGVLLCTISFDLIEEAFKKGGFDHAIVGFLVGAIIFLGCDLFLDHMGSGVELLLGALLDGIPESAVIGIGLVGGTQGLGFVMMVAVFLSNFPEGMAGTREMLVREGDGKQFTIRQTLLLWSAVTIISALSSLAGYAFLGHASDSWVGFMLALAGGAMLAMVAHTMIPEAFSGVKELTKTASDRATGTRWLFTDKIEAMAVVLGFLLTFFLTHISKLPT